MIDIAMSEKQLWFITGSQHLYGDEALQRVADNGQIVARALSDSSAIPLTVTWMPVVTTAAEAARVLRDASSDPRCAGVITWMHTFSPAKMWIEGLTRLSKPHLHLHTQFNRDLPWDGINMDFMNLNQSAHGGREFGFMNSRLRLDRKIVVGHWQDEEVLADIGAWARTALAVLDCRSMNIARIGDNMRGVAVTEGDKVSAQITFGYNVNGYGPGDVAAVVDDVSAGEVDRLTGEYADMYRMDTETTRSPAVKDAARIELGLRRFLEAGGFSAFTTTFENLHPLKQLPGLAVQRLMADGYGFAAEGDWKTAALTRTLKVMGAGRPGGTSFMEDYTYHLASGREKVLGAHMLEVCPSITDGDISLEVHPLDIGQKEDPARLVFTGSAGDALNATVVDLGGRFRMVVNTVEAVTPDAELPALPVARVLWRPRPDLKTAAAAWILAGGAHHTAYSRAVSISQLEDFADIMGIECVVIDEGTSLRQVRDTLRWNEAYYHLRGGFPR